MKPARSRPPKLSTPAARRAPASRSAACPSSSRTISKWRACPHSAGTPALKGYVPKKDAPVAAKLRAAGAIIIGKTNMHELAFGISGYNSAFKTGTEPGVRNAYDPTKIAGGSSSGTAAAIGARIVTAGLGTDTGGIGQAALRAQRLRLAASDRRPLSPGRHRADLAYPRHAGADGSHHGRRRDARPRHRRRRGGFAGRSEAGPHRRRQIDAGQSGRRYRDRVPRRASTSSNRRA